VHAYDSTWTLINGKETKLTVDNQVQTVMGFDFVQK
jgi:hypothetical protein